MKRALRSAAVRPSPIAFLGLMVAALLAVGCHDGSVVESSVTSDPGADA